MPTLFSSLIIAISLLGFFLGIRIMYVHRHRIINDRFDLLVAVLLVLFMLVPFLNLLIVNSMAEDGFGPKLPKMRIWRAWKAWWTAPIRWKDS